MEEKFSSIAKVHNEIELGLSLKGVMQLDNKWRLNLF